MGCVVATEQEFRRPSGCQPEGAFSGIAGNRGKLTPPLGSVASILPGHEALSTLVPRSPLQPEDTILARLATRGLPAEMGPL